MKSINSYPGHGTTAAYSCQSWIAKQINHYLHPGSYYCWFSKHFNAMSNGDDSNPIWIYLILDRAVKQGAVNNAKVKDLKANLLRAVDKELRTQSRHNEIPAAMAVISKASLQDYTPQLWKLNLNAIAGRYTGAHQYPDEYNIPDLKSNEFQVIIE